MCACKPPTGVAARQRPIVAEALLDKAFSALQLASHRIAPLG
jgi:hypothetical protein